MSNNKPTLATVWLDGCSGCHMSFLDMDERLLALAEQADLVYSPLVDRKDFPEQVDITLVEGAVSNEDDLVKIKKVRAHTRILVSLGDCAVTSNIPGMRNRFRREAGAGARLCRHRRDPETVSQLRHSSPARSRAPHPRSCAGGCVCPRLPAVGGFNFSDFRGPGCRPPAASSGHPAFWRLNYAENNSHRSCNAHRRPRQSHRAVIRLGRSVWTPGCTSRNCAASRNSARTGLSMKCRR